MTRGAQTVPTTSAQKTTSQVTSTRAQGNDRFASQLGSYQMNPPSSYLHNDRYVPPSSYAQNDRYQPPIGSMMARPIMTTIPERPMQSGIAPSPFVSGYMPGSQAPYGQDSQDYRLGSMAPGDIRNQYPQRVVDPAEADYREKLQLIMKEEEESRKANKENREKVDIKTNLMYKVLEKRTEEFERVLTSQNMRLVQGIIKGNATAFPLEDQTLPKEDPQRKRAEIYVALLGIIRYKSKEKKNKREFREYLDVIVSQIDSEVSQLNELLMFFMTRERKNC